MLTELPNIIDPVRVAQKGFTWDALVKISALPHLSEMLLFPENTCAQVQVKGFQDALRRCTIEGKVQATLNLSCQRCLEPMSLALEGDFKRCVVQTQAQADVLPEDYAPWMLCTEGLSLWDLVEESLILALPDVPKHSEDICQLSNDFI